MEKDDCMGKASFDTLICVLEWAKLGHSNETLFPSTFNVPFAY